MKSRSKFYEKYFFLYILLLVLFALNTAIAAFINFKMMLISALLTLTACVLVVVRIVDIRKTSQQLADVFEKETASGSKLLSNFCLPVIYTASSGEILWYNDKFKYYFNENNYLGKNIYEVFSCSDADKESDTFELNHGNLQFSAYCASSDGGYKIFYLVENTKYKHALRELSASKPVIMMLTYDNFNEVLRNSKDSEKNSFISAIHKEIEIWLKDIPCITVNKGDYYILVVLEERSLGALVEDKFSILDSVRKIKLNEISGVTLSVGVGRGGKNLSECEILCRQALDMAQSRGGDQAAIKSLGNEYKFFGGRAKAVERRTKVKARVIASAFSEMLLTSSKIIIMGHKYSDLDSLGASYGISTLASFMNKPSYIVFNPEKTLALPLYKRIIEARHDCIFTTGDDLDSVIDDRTLLVITDTHRADFVENPEVYKKCKNIVVIDHHRKAVDAIDNAVIFYHETATSSTCEMVSELMQYIDRFSLPKLGAEALLGGIMLDSKNFCLHTGVRTFEAAAYLRSCSADTVEVKKLFADSMLTYSRKTAIVSSAKLYKDCAISFDTESDSVTRVASSQAADELLNLENINASFVMYKDGDEISISARSLGAVNVQLIMEQLGGGGHQNMAACLLKCENYQKAYQLLLEAINEYKNNLP